MKLRLGKGMETPVDGPYVARVERIRDEAVYTAAMVYGKDLGEAWSLARQVAALPDLMDAAADVLNAVRNGGRTAQIRAKSIDALRAAMEAAEGPRDPVASERAVKLKRIRSGIEQERGRRRAEERMLRALLGADRPVDNSHPAMVALHERSRGEASLVDLMLLAAFEAKDAVLSTPPIAKPPKIDVDHANACAARAVSYLWRAIRLSQELDVGGEHEERRR